MRLSDALSTQQLLFPKMIIYLIKFSKKLFKLVVN